jgi:hypothetical protein
MEQTSPVLLHLPVQLKNDFSRIAERNDRSTVAEIRHIMREHVERNREQEQNAPAR